MDRKSCGIIVLLWLQYFRELVVVRVLGLLGKQGKVQISSMLSISVVDINTDEFTNAVGVLDAIIKTSRWEACKILEKYKRLR